MALDDTHATPFFRALWVLRLREDCRPHPHQGGIVYALLANANRSPGDPSSFPDGFLPIAPEQGRVWLREGDTFAFGGTLLDSSASSATARFERLTQNLQRIGDKAVKASDRFGGNYTLEPDPTLLPVPLEQIDSELQRLLPLETLTLRFVSPLRTQRPTKDRKTGSRFLDGSHFDPQSFLHKVLLRLPQVGIQRRDQGEVRTPDGGWPVELLENRLVWIDLGYGKSGERKRLGGAIGSVRLAVTSVEAKAALVWGQYAHIGKNLNFGFGAYRIVEAGPDAYACRRSISLLEAAFRPKAIDRQANLAEIEGGQLRNSAHRVLADTYIPAPPVPLTLRTPDGEQRRLLIPPVLDRALQRMVLDEIAIGIDRFFEESSFAWRKGLSRASAAKHMSQAYNQGYRFAVHADFDRFFESVDLAVLEDRLRAYLQEDRVCDLILTWVRAGRPGAALGLPTGAPLSPLLANIMLDGFDEQIAQAGGRLVRYGDDFLILTRTPEEAERLYQTARQLPADLHLRFNDNPTPILDLREPFEFLGFRFERETDWQPHGPDGPRPLDRLGWRDAKQQPTGEVMLPGETRNDRPRSSSFVLGPDAWELTLHEGKLQGRRLGTPESAPLLAESGAALTALGPVTLGPGVVGHLLAQDIDLLFADELGRIVGTLGTEPLENADTVLAQARVCADPHRRLDIARCLISAKLANYATLADAAPDRHGDTAVADALREAGVRVNDARNLEAVRGIEGSAASRWFGRLQYRLGPNFHFDRRHSPNAEDPVNVMLNIASTHSYRLCLLAVRSAGLAPSLGLFHAPSNRYASLAADLQEPFRHLIDRCVLSATRSLKPGQFLRTERGPFRLILTADAKRRFHALILRTLTLCAKAPHQDEAVSYREQIFRTARSLRRHLLIPKLPFNPSDTHEQLRCHLRHFAPRSPTPSGPDPLALRTTNSAFGVRDLARTGGTPRTASLHRSAVGPDRRLRPVPHRPPPSRTPSALAETALPRGGRDPRRVVTEAPRSYNRRESTPIPPWWEQRRGDNSYDRTPMSMRTLRSRSRPEEKPATECWQRCQNGRLYFPCEEKGEAPHEPFER